MYVKHTQKISETNVLLVKRYSCWPGCYKTEVLRGGVAMVTIYVIITDVKQCLSLK